MRVSSDTDMVFCVGQFVALDAGVENAIIVFVFAREKKTKRRVVIFCTRAQAHGAWPYRWPGGGGRCQRG